MFSEEYDEMCIDESYGPKELLENFDPIGDEIDRAIYEMVTGKDG